MTYTKTTWTDNTTPLSASNMNHLETQYDSIVSDYFTTQSYLRTDSGAPNPQVVKNPVTWNSLQSFQGTDGVQITNPSIPNAAWFWIDEPDTTHLRISNGAYPGASGVITIDTAGTINLSSAANQSADHPLNVQSPDGSAIWFLPSASQGAYNSLVHPGDAAIIFNSQGSSANTSYLTIAPWSGITAGIRIGSDGTLTTPGSINGTGPAHISYSNTYTTSTNENVTITISGLNTGASSYALAITGLGNYPNQVVIGNGSNWTSNGGTGYGAPEASISSINLSGGTLTIAISLSVSGASTFAIGVEGMVL